MSWLLSHKLVRDYECLLLTFRTLLMTRLIPMSLGHDNFLGLYCSISSRLSPSQHLITTPRLEWKYFGPLLYNTGKRMKVILRMNRLSRELSTIIIFIVVFTSLNKHIVILVNGVSISRHDYKPSTIQVL